MKCQRQDRDLDRDDILTPCPNVGERLTFFRDEVRRKCRVGHEIAIPNGFGCAMVSYAEQSWAHAEEAKERKKRNKGFPGKDALGNEESISGLI